MGKQGQCLQTLAAGFERAGVGLHSGADVTVRVQPAAAAEGRYFIRLDQPDAPRLRANLTTVAETQLSTELAASGTQVRTVEHLLAALAASRVDCARIEIDGPEVPLLDGSAREWVEAIATVGLTEIAAAAPNPPLVVTEPVTVQAGDAFVIAMPAPETRFTYGIDFPYPAIGSNGRAGRLPRKTLRPTSPRLVPSGLLTKSSSCAKPD